MQDSHVMNISVIITFVIGIASVYFFYEFEFTIAVLLLIWTLSRLFGVRFKQFGTGVGGALIRSEREQKCKTQISIDINVEELLKTDIVKERHEFLVEKKAIKEKSFDAWVKEMLKNYQKHNITDRPFHSVEFLVQGEIVWKDKEIQYMNIIDYEIFIPVDPTKFKKDDMIKSGFTGLQFEVNIVNGLMKLRLNGYDKKNSPRVVREGILGVYKTSQAVTSFPLIYCSIEHSLPMSMLNLSLHGTESYWLNKGDEKIDWVSDLRSIQEVFATYNYLCDHAEGEDTINDKKWMKGIKDFAEKKELLLKSSDTKDIYDKTNEDYFMSRMTAGNYAYQNNIWRIYITNINERKEMYLERALSDYYEEMP